MTKIAKSRKIIGWVVFIDTTLFTIFYGLLAFGARNWGLVVYLLGIMAGATYAVTLIAWMISKNNHNNSPKMLPIDLEHPCLSCEEFLQGGGKDDD